MTIKVTQEHIDTGESQQCERCPIALAMLDAGLRHPWVDEVAVCFSTDVRAHQIDLPDEAIKFIERFDDCLDVEPFSFELEV